MRKRDLTSKSRHIRVHLGFCYQGRSLDGRQLKRSSREAPYFEKVRGLVYCKN